MLNRWNMIFNILVLLFWLYFWSGRNKKIFFNPYLSSIMGFTSKAVNYLRPLTGSLPITYTALIAMFLMLVLRAFLGPLFEPHLNIGLLSWNIQTGSLPTSIACSFIIFLKFLIPLFALSTLYVHDKEEYCPSEESVFLFLAKPFSYLNRNIRPLVLLLFVILLLILMNFISPLHVISNGNMPIEVGGNIVLILVSALYQLIGVLNVMYQFCIFLIIFSWIALFTGSAQLASFSRSWLYFLMGPIKNMHLAIGPFDLTPLIFIFGIRILYALLAGILQKSFISMLG